MVVLTCRGGIQRYGREVNETMHQPKTPIRRRSIHWELLGLHNPAVVSIDEIRRQIISASSSGLSPETLVRGQNVGLSPQSAVQKPTSNQMRKVRA